MQGQNLVFLLLVTPSVTVPVGVAFYRPDPARTTWAKQDKLLAKKGLPQKERPPEPQRNAAYPTKIELALRLVAAFKQRCSHVKVRGVLADAAYATAKFMDDVSSTYSGIQVVSELRSNQLVMRPGGYVPVAKYFSRQGVSRNLPIRGDKEQIAMVDSARLHVRCHGKKRFIIALRYEGEESYRYLVASALTWRTLDIAQLWTLRWLVEVFFEDWKAHGGFAALTKQRGEEGSHRGLILSLLVDHCRLMHPEQLAQMKHKLPAFTVGSLTNRIRVDALVTTFEDLLQSQEPEEELKRFAGLLREQFSLRPSGKHMVGRNLGRQEPTRALQYRAQGKCAQLAHA